MLALAMPAFRETSDDDWLKKSELAVTFLDRYGNEVGSRGIKHNDFDPARGVPRPSDQGDAGDRGPPLLRAFRHRSVGPVPRAVDQRARRRRGAGRLLDHPAARQEPVPHQRAHDRAQDQGGVPGDLAGDAADQERDPQALSRPRLSRRRRLRRRRRGAVLFQQVGARREPGGSRDAGRPVQGAGAVRPAHQPAGRARARQRRARQPGRGRLHDRRPGVRRAAESRQRRRPPRRALAELLPRLGVRRDEEARRHVPEIDERARVPGAHRARREPAARRRAGGRNRCASTAATTTPSRPPPWSWISTARCAPWSAAATTARASSTAPPTRCASRAPRSSPTSTPTALSDGIKPTSIVVDAGLHRQLVPAQLLGRLFRLDDADRRR